MKPSFNFFTRSFKGFVSALAGALLVVTLFTLTLWAKGLAPALAVSTTPINRDARLGNSFASTVKKAAPSVVTIYSSRTVREQPRQNPFRDNPMLQQFFGDQYSQDEPPRSRREGGLGSGVIVSSNGYILTANHVVSGADEIKVALTDDDKKEYIAQIIGTDPQTDIAVLKIDATDLPAITLADSDQLEVGDVVLAIGNPLYLGQSVTMGIISGLGRHYGVNGLYGYENFIQTDAAINKGNSGGALVDAEGRLIGINTWIASLGGGNEGLGFAVPVNTARRVVERLISGGKITHGYLGLSLKDITSDFEQEFNLPDQNGALVEDTVPNGPADKAGIKSGDVIIGFNNKPIGDTHNLQLVVSDSAADSSATVKVIRDGVQKNFTVVLAQSPIRGSQDSQGQGGSDAGTSDTDALDGVTLDNLDRDARQQLRIPATVQGVIVTDVDQDSNSAAAGLQKNDVILEIDRQPVTDADNAIKLCTQAKGNRILLKIWHPSGQGGGTHFLIVDNTKKTAK
jgi:serine protease Do